MVLTVGKVCYLRNACKSYIQLCKELILGLWFLVELSTYSKKMWRIVSVPEMCIMTCEIHTDLCENRPFFFKIMKGHHSKGSMLYFFLMFSGL